MSVVQAIKRRLAGSRAALSVLEAVDEFRNPSSATENVVMFHTGRCGSTVLGSMLKAHPNIYWGGEIFERLADQPKSPLSRPNAFGVVLNRSRRLCREAHKSTYGFELKYLPLQHLRKGCLNMNLEDCLSRLRRLQFSRFIILQRENYLRRAVSAEVGRHNQKWHATANPGKPTKVTLNLQAFPTGKHPEPLLDLFRAIDANYEKLQRLLKDDRVLLLSYEKDILEDPKRAYLRTCEFLNVAPGTPEVRLARTNPFSLEDMLENVGEVRALLKGTPYEWMLDC